MKSNLGLAPIKKIKSLKDIAYEEIKKIVISGKISPDKFYSSTQFAQMLGISRTPVREAIMQLEAEKVLVMNDGKGFKIKDSSAKEIKDFFETRKILETHMLKNFYNKMKPEDLEYLQIELDLMKKFSIAEEDSVRFIEADKKFHSYFMQKTKNQFLHEIMNGLQELITILGLKTIQKIERKGDVIQEHQKILDALKDKNLEKATQYLTEHLNQTEELLLRHASSAHSI